MKKATSILLFFFIAITGGSAQKKPTTNNAIAVLLATQTIVSMDSARTVMNKKVRSVKSEIEAGRIRASAADTLASKYNASVKKFNDIILAFQNDLLNRSKRRLILNDPLTYEKAMKSDILDAKKFYNSEFEGYYRKITGKQTSILLILTAIVDIYKAYKEIDGQIKKMKEEFVYENFTKKVLFPTWEQI